MARKPFLIPTLGAPSPLLKRLIRYPISMEPGSTQRAQVFDTARPPLGVPARVLAQQDFVVRRDARARPGPVDHAPVDRPLPFGRRRAAGEADAGARGLEAS